MEELFNGQLSFADIDAEKFLHVRRAHADRRVNAMDRLTDDVINELIQLCLPHYHIKAGETVQQGRPYTRLEAMVRVHLLQVSLNLSDLEMESYLASDMVARNFCRVSSTRLFISDSTILRFRHFIEQHGLAQKFHECTVNLAAEAGADMGFLFSSKGVFETLDSVKRACDQIKVPILYCLMEFCPEVCFTLEELRQAGVRAVIWPNGLLMRWCKAASDLIQQFKETGDCKTFFDQLMPIDQCNQLLGIRDWNPSGMF